MGQKMDFLQIRIRIHYPPQTKTTLVTWRRGLKVLAMGGVVV